VIHLVDGRWADPLARRNPLDRGFPGIARGFQGVEVKLREGGSLVWGR
jgi:hypothetical protein